MTPLEHAAEAALHRGDKRFKHDGETYELRRISPLGSSLMGSVNLKDFVIKKVAEPEDEPSRDASWEGENRAPDPGVKDTNPKDAIGSTKPGLGAVPSTALFELAAAHNDGALKYGRHNWRVAGVRASIYREAIDRHLAAFWEGEDRAPDSGCLHLAHIMACCAILIDARACGKLTDDRPPRLPDDWMDEARRRHAEQLGRYPEPVAPFTEAEHGCEARGEFEVSWPGAAPVPDEDGIVRFKVPLVEFACQPGMTEEEREAYMENFRRQIDAATKRAIDDMKRRRADGEEQ